MNITDTHTHLYAEEFDMDRNEMMQRAINNGVTRFFIPAIDSNYIQKMYALEANYPENVFLMMGLHPTYVKDNYLDELQMVEQQLASRKFYAIGEIGIDLYWDKTHLKEQQIAFRKQIQLAKKYKLPIVIHCREAFDEIFEILEEEKSDHLFGIFHCFSGDAQMARYCADQGWFMSFAGVITFPSATDLRAALALVPDELVLVETDAPYLTPAPFRGRPNATYLTPLTVRAMAEARGTTEAELAPLLFANAQRAFGAW
jgi:TatD DNase family protein